jgi:hypothetical protein
MLVKDMMFNQQRRGYPMSRHMHVMFVSLKYIRNGELRFGPAIKIRLACAALITIALYFDGRNIYCNGIPTSVATAWLIMARPPEPLDFYRAGRTLQWKIMQLLQCV